MVRTTGVIAGVIFFLAGLAVSGEEAWKILMDTNGIEVSSMAEQGLPGDTFRGVCVVDRPFEVVGAVLTDFPSYTAWFYRCREARVVREKDRINLSVYLALSAPWPFSGRDVVLDAVTTVDLPARRAEVIACAARDPLVAERKDFVRVTDARLRVILEGLAPGKTRVTYISRADPGGNIPRFLINLAGRHLTYRTLANFRKTALDPKYGDMGKELLRYLEDNPHS
jgi:hypothetical protein